MPKFTTINAQDLELALYDYAQPQDPKQAPKKRILFLHGYLDTARSFDALAEELQDQFDCQALSFRGHGQSERAGKGASFHLLDHGKDLYCVMNELKARGQTPDLVVAHSMGAIIALYVAGTTQNFPDIIALDGLGGQPEAAEDQPERLHLLLKSIARKKVFKPVNTHAEGAKRIQALNRQLSDEGAMRMVKHALVERDGKLHFAFDRRLRGPVPLRYPETFWLALFKRIQGSVTVMRAEFGIVPKNDIVDARFAALRAKVIEVPGVGHHLHVDSIPTVLDAILTSLK